MVLHINPIENVIHAIFVGLLNQAQAGALALFVASVLVSLVFYIIAIARAVFIGGGSSVLAEAMMRILVLLGLSALVLAWPVFAQDVEADINAFAAAMAGVSPGGGPDFTPDGIMTTHNHMITLVMAAGQGHGFLTNVEMMLWKLISVACLWISGVGLALALFFANVSLDIVLAGCAVLIGFVINPWLRDYAMQYVGVIIGTGVFIIMVGILVGVSQILGNLEIGVLTGVPNNAAPGQVLAGPAMIEMAVLDMLFMVLSWTVPKWCAEKISGGPPIIQIGSLLSAAQRGASSVGL
jgi:hypothetical protein